MPLVVHQTGARPAAVAHQPGITDRQPAQVRLAAFDLDRHPAEVLAAWAATAGALMAAHRAERLTVTFGLGPSLFDERFGLAARRPAGLVPLPAFPGDALDPARSDGDVGVQVGAEDAAVADAALAALGATPRWVQAGFIGPAAPTPRNLLGFKDGTINPRRPAALDRHVWAGTGDRTAMAGGTYLVYRRIRLDVRGFRALPLEEQERRIGRRRQSGGPLHGGREFDPRVVDRLPPDSHVALASHERNAGVHMLRRAYDFADARDDAGLLFVCFVRDPPRQFVPVQQRLAEQDPLNQHAVHTASALFAVPPAGRPGGFPGDRLLRG